MLPAYMVLLQYVLTKQIYAELSYSRMNGISILTQCDGMVGKHI